MDNGDCLTASSEAENRRNAEKQLKESLQYHIGKIVDNENSAVGNNSKDADTATKEAQIAPSAGKCHVNFEVWCFY